MRTKDQCEAAKWREHVSKLKCVVTAECKNPDDEFGCGYGIISVTVGRSYIGKRFKILVMELD